MIILQPLLLALWQLLVIILQPLLFALCRRSAIVILVTGRQVRYAIAHTGHRKSLELLLRNRYARRAACPLCPLMHQMPVRQQVNHRPCHKMQPPHQVFLRDHR